MFIEWRESRIPELHDTSQRMRAYCHLDPQGKITLAQLYRWGTVRWVCFGRGHNEHDWIPTEHVWRARTDARENRTDVEPFTIATMHSPTSAIFGGDK